MSFIRRFTSLSNSEVFVRRFNSASIIIILAYYYVGLLSYITAPWRSFHHLFVFSSVIAVTIRAILTAIICLYSLLVLFFNKKKLEWKWLVVFIYILLFTLLSFAISPQSYVYSYISNLYNVVNIVYLSNGITVSIISFLSSISDFALAFCFLFILPYVLKGRKQLFILLFPIVLLTIVECLYSVVVEMDEYIDIFKMSESQYSGYTNNIGATFGNKQDWGSFLVVGFMSSLFSLFLTKSNKLVNRFFKIFLIVCMIIIFIFTVFSLCKTAIVSETLVIFAVMIYCLMRMFKKNKKAFLFTIISFLLISSSILIVLISPLLNSIHFVNSIRSVLYNYIIKRINISTILGRTSIWYRTLENLRTYNLLFGLSKSGVDTYSKISIIEGQTGIHNGFAYFLLSYGIFGFSIYVMLLVMVVKRIINLKKVDIRIMFCMICSLLCALIFVAVEGEVLIVSGSIPIFIFNVLICSFSKYYETRV